MSAEHFPKDSKPFDIAVRAFHRIDAKGYDIAVDTNIDARGQRIGNKVPPSGLARDSGARGPDAFLDSGFLAKVTALIAKLAKGALRAIPGVNFIPFLDDLIGKLTGKPPLEALSEALGKLLSSAVEGALFARYMRSIPAWVPVGRKGYEREFTYREDGAPRTVAAEEEREIEGRLVASYALVNDTVFSQWSHFRHWSFQVLPAAGFRYLIGAGNIPDADEQKFIDQEESRTRQPEFRRVLSIYGQTFDPSLSADRGAIECLMDVGAISAAPGDKGAQGVMFNPAWPYWPMAGDHFWATGRWAYDCTRAVQRGGTELFPTQINPIKAFASSRFEGFKFADNPKFVPTTRFFFFATNEGGYTEFRSSSDRNGTVHESGIVLGDRDYVFLVDLPPRSGTASDFAIGATINFPLNTLVLRPRLLMDVKHAPFGIGLGAGASFADGLTFEKIEPIIEVLRPADPQSPPTQARITIPLSKIPKPADPKKPRAVGMDISLGWHDPSEVEARSLFKVTVQLRQPVFFANDGPARLATAVNGRWRMMAESVSSRSGEPPVVIPPAPTRIIHEQVLFLPREAPVSVVSSGTWIHGFGEFIEFDTLRNRRLRVGGLLVDVDSDTKKKLQAFIDDARKTVADIRRTAADIKDPKPLLKAELKKKLDRLKQQQAPPETIAALEKEIDTLVDDLPDTPDALKSALGDLDKRLGQMTEGLGAVEDFLRITDDFIGQSFFPGWHEDIDAAIKKDKLEESKRVSAIARTMFLKPTPVFTKSDEPMGWVEFVDTVRTPLGRDPMGKTFDVSASSANVAKLLGTQQSSGGKPLRIRMRARRFTIVGSGNNLAEKVNHPASTTDYEFELNVFIEPQIP